MASGGANEYDQRHSDQVPDVIVVHGVDFSAEVEPLGFADDPLGNWLGGPSLTPEQDQDGTIAEKVLDWNIEIVERGPDSRMTQEWPGTDY